MESQDDREAKKAKKREKKQHKKEKKERKKLKKRAKQSEEAIEASETKRVKVDSVTDAQQGVSVGNAEQEQKGEKKREREEEEVLQEDHKVPVEDDEAAKKRKEEKEKKRAAKRESDEQREARRRKKLLESAAQTLPAFMREGRLLTDARVPFGELEGVSKRMADVLRESMRVETTFPVQTHLVPFLLKESRYCGGDALVMSATGSGKTLAFAVPISELAIEARRARINFGERDGEKGSAKLFCLCVLPTRDLAAQVYEVFCELLQGTEARASLFSGDRPFWQEVEEIKSGRIDILICTPGRLRDHVREEEGNLLRTALKTLRFLVVDEGDRLLSKQNHLWIDLLMPLLVHPVDTAEGPFDAPPLQKCVFSATMTSNPRKLAQLRLYRPTFFYSAADEQLQKQDDDDDQQVEVVGEQTGSGPALLTGVSVLPATLKEYAVVSPTDDDKPLSLLWILERFLTDKPKSAATGAGVGGCLVFIDSVERAQRLVEVLSPIAQSRGAISISLFSSRLTGKQRAVLLEQFKQGAIRVLIVTDVLARGLDVANVGCVVNYDCPFRAQTYVHRVGRTARAGSPGEAFTLGLWTDLGRWMDMRRTLLGGNVGDKLRPHRSYFEQLRPLYIAELDRVKLQVRGKPEVQQAAEWERKKKALQMPLQMTDTVIRMMIEAQKK